MAYRVTVEIPAQAEDVRPLLAKPGYRTCDGWRLLCSGVLQLVWEVQGRDYALTLVDAHLGLPAKIVLEEIPGNGLQGRHRRA